MNEVTAVAALLAGLAVLAAPARGVRGAAPAGGSPAQGAGDPRDRSPGGRVTEAQVATAIVLLALAFRSGLPTTSVLDAAARHVSDTTARDLRQVATALLWGATPDEAWASVDERWASAARAIRVASAAGVPPGPVLLRAAEDLRRDAGERAESAVARAGVRLVLPLGLVLLPAFCLTTVVPLVLALGGRLLTG